MKKIRLFACLAFFSFQGIAQVSPSVTKLHYHSEKGVMLDGYDPVAYFTGKPSKGKSTWLASYEGVTYAFKSLENKQKFLQSPQMFVPQYGGWCAYAMGATGEKVEVDPETFKIVDGKLYLFYNAFFNNTLPKWNENEKELKGKADANWSKFLKSK